jgi:hypothetical protein
MQNVQIVEMRVYFLWSIGDNMEKPTYWLQKLYWVCPACGLMVSDQELQNCTMRDEFEFYMCPGCGKESVI